MRKTILLAGMLCVGYASAQEGKVGINTTDPKASLEVSLSENNRREEATTNEGLLIPRISKVRTANMESPEKSTLIYVNATDYTGSDDRVSEIKAEGFYFFDGAKWRAIASGSVSGNASGALTGNIGINQPTPDATLDIHKSPEGDTPVGVLFPRLSQDERNAMAKDKLKIGLQIFNKDKNCIDWWTGKAWQCMDGMMRDEHGAEARFRVTEKWFAPNDITIYKSNCPVGLQAKEEAKVVISHTQPNPNPPIEGEGTAIGMTEGDARDKALELAKADFYRRAQDYVNGKFGASFCEALPVKDPDRGVVFTNNGNSSVALESRAYWFSSIEDSDYLPLKPYQGPATLEQIPADGVASGKEGQEPPLKSLAKIPTVENAIQVYIPIKLTSGSNLSLSEHIMHIDIPAEYTADGRAGVVTFTWNPVEVDTSTRFIPAKFYAKEEITLKGLDLIGGLGDDHKGLVIGTFRYPANSSEATRDQWTGKYELRLISGILDKNFMYKSQLNNVEDYRHRFIYVPVQGPDGKMWLSNNLGADYANINHAAFNPGQQAKSPTDYHAYGSLNQWGRRFNGRELMTWGNGTSSGTNSINYPTFKDEPGYNWSTDESNILVWEGDNCPEGWHTPADSEFQTMTNANNGSIMFPRNTPESQKYQQNQRYYYLHGLRVPYAGIRISTSGSRLSGTGSYSGLWSRTEYSSTVAYYLNSGTSVNYNDRSYGYALRCLKNN